MHSGTFENQERGYKKIVLVKKLFINLFKYAFFCLEDFTLRAAPGIRNVFKTCARADSCFWIPLCRIIDIVTFETDPSCVFYIR